MDVLHNSKNIGSNVEPEAGERTLLCSNTADIRSPALGIYEDNDEISHQIVLEYLAKLLVDIYFDNKEDAIR